MTYSEELQAPVRTQRLTAWAEKAEIQLEKNTSSRIYEEIN